MTPEQEANLAANAATILRGARGKVNSVVGGNFVYVCRCKRACGGETHKKTHAARDSSTLCGKPLGGMWYALSAWGRTPEDVDCRECRRALMANNSHHAERKQ